MATSDEFDQVIARCRALYAKKLHDYGAAWRVMRPESITDQLYIKVKRIRTLQMDGHAQVDEGVEPEFVAIVNYGLMGLIQLEHGAADIDDLAPDAALALYDKQASEVRALMLRKNHDYGEAWRTMRVSSFADLILMKVLRAKQIEDLDGKTTCSEGVGANYADMINYAVFALIQMKHED